MADQMFVFRKPQIAKESTSGTAVQPNRTLGSLEFALNFDPMVQAFSPAGYLLATTAGTNYEETKCPIKGTGDYNEMLYLLSSLLHTTTPTTPGGATLSRLWTYNLTTSSPHTPATYTIEAGDTVRAARACYLLPSEATLAFDFEKGVAISGSAFAQKALDDKVFYITVTGGPATSGTWDYTIGGQTAAGLAKDISAANLQTALEALSNVAPGDVACSGGPLQTLPITCVWAGAYQYTDVPAQSATDTFDAGDISISRLAPGATAATLKPILGSHLDFYAATTYAGLPGTALTRAFDINLKIANRWGAIKPIRTANNGTFAAHAELKPKITLAFSVGADSTGMNYLNYLRQNSKMFVRLLATGTTIETGFSYYAQFDAALLLTKVNPIKDGGGLSQINFEGEVAHDTTWGQGFKAVVQNIMTAL